MKNINIHTQKAKTEGTVSSSIIENNEKCGKKFDSLQKELVLLAPINQ